MKTRRIFRMVILVLVPMFLGSYVQAKEWTDVSGRFKIEAEMVSANDELVVLRTPNHRLLALELKELSEADRKYIREHVGELSKGEQLQPPDDAQTDETAIVVEETEGDAETVVRETSVERSVWRLTNGQSLVGEFIGFEKKPLIVSRRLDQVYVGNTSGEELEPFYQRMIPSTVAHLEGADVKSLLELEEWMEEAGAGPWKYDIDAVVIESAEHGRISVPIFLLDKASLVVIKPAFERWEAIHAAELAESDVTAHLERERFLTRAELLARQADEAIDQRAQRMSLEFYSAATGVTDMWEVMLVPVRGFGFPFTVLVPGQDSLTAQQVATQRYPGYRVAGVEKATW